MAKATQIDEEIARTVRRARESAGVVKAEMARHIGMSRQSYQELEKGNTSFTVSCLLKISKKLKISFTDLIDGIV